MYHVAYNHEKYNDYIDLTRGGHRINEMYVAVTESERLDIFNDDKKDYYNYVVEKNVTIHFNAYSIEPF